MLTYGAYTVEHLARLLQRSGQWDAALALLPDTAGLVRAQILVDQSFWRREGQSAAQAAVDGLDRSSPVARYLAGQLAYARLLFDVEPQDGDRAAAEAGFQAAADDAELAGWGAFWHGVYADNILDDPALARTWYDQALGRCDGDLLLESYVVRHIGGHALASDRAEGERLLRRSLHLRAALGARPHVAAAQATLASELPEGPEREILRETALATATELGIPWLIEAIEPAR